MYFYFIFDFLKKYSEFSGKFVAEYLCPKCIENDVPQIVVCFQYFIIILKNNKDVEKRHTVNPTG